MPDRHRPRGLPVRLALAAAGLLLAADAVMAEAVPLPRPAPKGRIQVSAAEPLATPSAASAAIPAPPKVAAPRTVTRVAAVPNQPPPNPVIPDPRRNTPANIFSSFDAAQKAQAGKVSAYLSSLGTLVGNFVQVGPDGSRTTGDFFIQKPGKVRFEYDSPSPIAMISDGSSLAVRDRKLATQDIYPLSQTPLRYLLSDKIDLLRDTNVVSVTADDLYINVIIEEKSAIIGTSRLLLMYSVKDNQLRQWTVTDPQGYDTTVAIYNLDQAKKPDPSLFKIDFTNYNTPNN